MELEAACEQYKRALETNYVSQDQVSKMSAKFMEMHVKVAPSLSLCFESTFNLPPSLSHIVGFTHAHAMDSETKAIVMMQNAVTHSLKSGPLNIENQSYQENDAQSAGAIAAGGEPGGRVRPLQAAGGGVAKQIGPIRRTGACDPSHVRAGLPKP